MREWSKENQQAAPSAGAARVVADHTRTSGYENDGPIFSHIKYIIDENDKVQSYWSPVPIGFCNRVPELSNDFNPYRSHITRFSGLDSLD